MKNSLEINNIKIIARRLKRMVDVGPIPNLFWNDLDFLLNLILKEDEENNDKRSIEAIEETKSVVREKKVKAPSSLSDNFIN